MNIESYPLEEIECAKEAGPCSSVAVKGACGIC